MKRLRCVCLLLLMITLPFLLGCSQEIKSYLREISFIEQSMIRMNVEISKFYEDVEGMDLVTVNERCNYFSNRYELMLSKLTSLEYPRECSVLRDHMIDSLTLHSRYFTELSIYYSYPSQEQWAKAQSTIADAGHALALGHGEMDRLVNKYQIELITVAEEE